MRRARLLNLGLAGLFALVGTVTLAAGASAQAVTTSAVTGRVTDPKGKPVASAQVTVTNTQTGTTNGGLTDTEGRYYIPYLQPGGPYTVQASSIGYQTIKREGLTLTLGQNLRADFTLPEQAVQLQGLEVTAESNPTFSPSKTGAQTIVTQNDINNLPTLNRNFADFALLSPHVVVAGASQSIGGQNNRYNNIQIDGAVNNDVFGLGSSGVPGDNVNAKPISIEAIKEYQVMVAPFDVRQAGFTGGLINAVTRGGTNQFKGEVFGNFRNKSMVGGLSVNGSPVALGSFSDADYGFTLGGPIVRDKIHFFTANEFTSRSTPMRYGTNVSSAADIGVAPDSVQRFINILKNTYKVDPGTGSAVTQTNPNQNLFGRLDFELGKSRLTVRDNFVHGTNESGVSRGGSYYSLTSNGIDYTSTANSAVAQLFTNFSDRWHNEALLNYETIREPRNPATYYPDVQVTVYSDINGTSVKRTLEAGAEYYSQDNLLNQDILQFTDNVTGVFGAHRITVGTSDLYFHFENHFFPGSIGRYTFSSLANFQAGNAASYTLAVKQPGISSVAAVWGTYQLGGYAQDEWTVSPHLNVSFGLRLDVPIIPTKPRENAAFASASGISTSQVPSGNVLWSPRVGFNYRTSGDHVTQIRGGIGLFTGRPPYVWLSNLYTNTGTEQAQLSCRGSLAPTVDLQNPPTACADGSTATPGATQINTFAKDFKFPQDLKFDLAVDRQLGAGFSATLEGLYTKAINAVYYKEMNLQGVQGQSDPSLGIGVRDIYGTPTVDGFAPVRKWNGFYQVVEGTNTGSAHSYSVSAELKKNFNDRIFLQGSYTYSRAYDTQSLTSSIATSNIGYNPITSSIDNPRQAPSVWDRPSKIMLSGTVRLFPKYGGTDVSLIYVGQSGELYNYTYDEYYTDINGDGYGDCAHGLCGRNNDLIYVPANVNDLHWSSPDDARLFSELMAKDPCLQKAAGKILPRNSCRSPWQNRLNLRVGQNLHYGTGNLEVFLDIFNFLNLLDSKWGVIQYPQYNTNTALSFDGRLNNDPNGPFVFSYYGATEKDASGQTHAALPLVTNSLDSRWQMQLGARISF